MKHYGISIKGDHPGGTARVLVSHLRREECLSFLENVALEFHVAFPDDAESVVVMGSDPDDLFAVTFEIVETS